MFGTKKFNKRNQVEFYAGAFCVAGAAATQNYLCEFACYGRLRRI